MQLKELKIVCAVINIYDWLKYQRVWPNAMKLF